MKKNGLFLVQELEYMNVIKILGLPKSFGFVMWSICGAILKIRRDKANRGLFQPYRLSKHGKMALFLCKNMKKVICRINPENSDLFAGLSGS